MRQIEEGNTLAVRAIGGLHVVTLAWDFVAGKEAKRDGLLGFAIERSEFDHGNVAERYFLRGIKRFKDKDEGLPPGTPVPTSEHPIQTFQWGEYTAAGDQVPIPGHPGVREAEASRAGRRLVDYGRDHDRDRRG